MRIVEPQKLANQHTVLKKRQKKYLLYSLLVLLVLTGSFALLINKNKLPATLLPKQPSVLVPPKNKPAIQRIFSGDELVSFYNHLSQPNLIRIITPPYITGNTEADTRIRQIAVQRGYKLRSKPATALKEVDGFPLQEVVFRPWLDMKAAAFSAGINFSIVSAYRSVATQRKLFMSELLSRGVSIQDVATGKANKAVNDVLLTSSIPGYSKHHTGYAMDLSCSGYIFENFKKSNCFKWLNSNNYQNAKRFGFIPSYPPDATSQGPNPEAWEYVYVGKDLLYTTNY